MNNYTQDLYWLRYREPKCNIDESAGKFIAYIRCDKYTTEKERLDFFKYVINLLINYCNPVNAKKILQVHGKIALTVNENNLLPFLFYCNEKDQILLKNALDTIKPFIEQKYPTWFEKKNGYRTITLNWTWKSNQQTLLEIASKTHWVYRSGMIK